MMEAAKYTEQLVSMKIRADLIQEIVAQGPHESPLVMAYKMTGKHGFDAFEPEEAARGREHMDDCIDYSDCWDEWWWAEQWLAANVRIPFYEFIMVMRKEAPHIPKE